MTDYYIHVVLTTRMTVSMFHY